MKRKRSSFARRAYARGRSIASGFKTDAIAGGAGGIAALADRHFLTPGKDDEQDTFFTRHWWAKGGLFVAVGLLARRMKQLKGMREPVGLGLMGAGVFKLVMDYYADADAEETSGDSAAVWGRRPWAAAQDAGAIVDNTFSPALGSREAAGWHEESPAYQWANG